MNKTFFFSLSLSETIIAQGVQLGGERSNGKQREENLPSDHERSSRSNEVRVTSSSSSSAIRWNDEEKRRMKRRKTKRKWRREFPSVSTNDETEKIEQIDQSVREWEKCLVHEGTGQSFAWMNNCVSWRDLSDRCCCRSILVDICLADLTGVPLDYRSIMGKSRALSLAHT